MMNTATILTDTITWSSSAAVAYCVWKSFQPVSCCHKRAQHVVTHYDPNRGGLSNHAYLRSLFAVTGVVTVTALTCVHLISTPKSVTIPQLLGLLLAYAVVAFGLICTAAVIMPMTRSTLSTYNSTIGVIIFFLVAVYCNFAHVMGFTHLPGHLTRVMFYVLEVHLDEATYVTYKYPVLAAALLQLAGCMHIVRSLSWSPGNVVAMATGFVFAGSSVPWSVNKISQHFIHPLQLPRRIYRALASTYHCTLALDLLLRVPRLAALLQSYSRSGNPLARLITALQAPLTTASALHSTTTADGVTIVYGVDTYFFASASAAVLLAAVACCAVVTLQLDPAAVGKKDDGKPAEDDLPGQLVVTLSEKPGFKHALDYLRGLNEPCTTALCVIITAACVQCVHVTGLLAAMVQAAFLQQPADLHRMPIALIMVLSGIVAQGAAIAYLTMSGSAASHHHHHHDASTHVAPPREASDLAVVQAQDVAMKKGLGLDVGRGPSFLQRTVSSIPGADDHDHDHDQAGEEDEHGGGATAVATTVTRSPASSPPDTSIMQHQAASPELTERLEALTHYKTFMVGLDQQPNSYSLNDFISGSGNAMRGIFPKVHHASFCLLSSNGTAVNMYTFIGEGSQRAPRTNVAVAPSTLLYNVIHTCRPVFIGNIATFQGPFSDVQFMRFVLGLRSVCCLPLVSPSGRMLGVLRLGFSESWEWSQQEMSIAKQVALILSSGSRHAADGGEAHSGPVGLATPGRTVKSPAGAGGGANSSRMSQESVTTTTSGVQPYVLYSATESQPHYSSQLSAPLQKTGTANGWPAPPTDPVTAAMVLSTSNGNAAYNMLRPNGPGNMAASSPGFVPSGVIAAHLARIQLAVASTGVLSYDAAGQPVNAASQHSPSAGGFPASFSSAGRPPSPVGMQSLLQSPALYAALGSQASTVSERLMQIRGSTHSAYPHSSAEPLGLLDSNTTALLAMTSTGMGSTPGSTSQAIYAGTSPFATRSTGITPAAVSGVNTLSGLASPGQQPAAQYSHARSGTRGSGNADLAWDEHASSASQRSAGGLSQGALRAQARVQSPGSSGSDEYKLIEVCGRGGFGCVYKAMWRGKLVAVKVLEHGDEFVGCADSRKGGHSRKLDMKSRRAALLEGAMTSTINHPNVVATYDYRVVDLNPPPTSGLGTTRISQETHIVMEWCDRGSLQDALEQGVFNIDKTLRSGKGIEVDMELVCMTLCEVSSAMDYLHTHRITHRDLKPKNVLLKSSKKDRRGFCAKVSDFGLSQVLPDAVDRTQVSKNYSGTVTHMPPELIEEGKVYPQGDVYAFGIMMWEIYTGSAPYAHMVHPQIMVAVVTHNLRPRFPEATPDWYKSLAYKCWHKDHKARPSFADITQQLMERIQVDGWQAVLNISE